MRYINLDNKVINSEVSKYLRTEKDSIIEWVNFNKDIWSKRFTDSEVDDIMITNITMSIQLSVIAKQKKLLKRKRIGLKLPTEDFIRTSVTKKLPKFIAKHF